MANSIEGIYLGAGATKMVGKDSNYAVRNFWVDVTKNDAYPSPVEFQLTQDNCVKVETLKPKARVEVYFNLEGRKWEKDGKSGVMNTVKAYRIDVIEKRSSVQNASAGGVPISNGGDDDLPF